MISKWKMLGLAAALVVSTGSRVVGAQRLGVPLEQLEGVRDETRMSRFYWLLHRRPGVRAFNAREATLAVLHRYPQERETIVATLVGLLARENAHAREHLHGVYMKYYALGEAAVGQTLRALYAAERDTRNTAIHVLGLLSTAAAAPSLPPAAKREVRAGLLRALADPVPMNRAAAIEALRTFTDDEVAAAVVRLVETDSAASVRRRAAAFSRGSGSATDPAATGVGTQRGGER